MRGSEAVRVRAARTDADAADMVVSAVQPVGRTSVLVADLLSAACCPLNVEVEILIVTSGSDCGRVHQ